MKSILKGLVVGAAVIFSVIGGAQEIQPMLDQMTSSFTLNDLNRKMYALEQLKGKYIVIHLAAICRPFCYAEGPNLNRIYSDYRDQGVAVFIVDVREGKKMVVKSFARFSDEVVDHIPGE